MRIERTVNVLLPRRDGLTDHAREAGSQSATSWDLRPCEYLNISRQIALPAALRALQKCKVKLNVVINVKYDS